jgi:phage terminase large subunit GpA-like protein
VSDFFGQVKSSLTADDVGAAIARKAQPPPKQGVVEWAEGNLSIGNTAHLHGPYRTRETPYIREVLECFGDESVRRLSLVWAAQTAKTTAILAGMAYRLDQNPAPALWVMPSALLARSFSKSRWLPMVESSDALKAHKPDNADDLTILEQHFKGMSVYFVGSNSPANLSSRSISLLMMDEMDKFAAQSGKEASPIQLAEARTTTFPNHLIVCTSTPTYENGAIWTEWLKGDQRKYFVPCLGCGEAWPLEWDHIKWDESAKQESGWNMQTVAETTRCVCPKCGHAHAEPDKREMLDRGQWRATDFAAEAGRRSYHLSSLYSPWRKWSDLSVKFLQDRDAAGGLQDFFNRELALPWKMDGSRITTAMIRERIDASPKYLLGQPPSDGVLARLMAVDVQQTELWWLVRQLHEDGSSYLVQYGSALGWGGLSEKFRELGCQWGIVDAGYAAKATSGVYNFVFGTAGKFCAAFGRTKKHNSSLKPWETGELQIDGTRTIRQMRFDALLWQERLYHDVLRDGRVPWYLPRDLAKDYVSQMQNEALVDDKDEKKWQRFGPNHLADCEKMALVYMDCFLSAFRAQNATP